MKDYVSDNFIKVYWLPSLWISRESKNRKILTSSKSMTKLNGVRHNLELQRNLLTIGQLDVEGYIKMFCYNN